MGTTKGSLPHRHAEACKSTGTSPPSEWEALKAEQEEWGGRLPGGYCIECSCRWLVLDEAAGLLRCWSCDLPEGEHSEESEPAAESWRRAESVPRMSA